jgi:hypothetical protein
MEVTMLLCDRAQVAEGKLYVLGAGWNQVDAGVPFPCEVAVLVEVPWTATNEKHDFAISLVTEDGDTVEFGDAPVQIAGQFEVGRPTGIKPGSALNQQMVFKYGMLSLPPSGYVFEFSIADQVLARKPFRVGDA